MTCENETEQVNIRYGVIISAADCNLNGVSPLRRCLVSPDGVEDLAHVAHVLLRYVPWGSTHMETAHCLDIPSCLLVGHTGH